MVFPVGNYNEPSIPTGGIVKRPTKEMERRAGQTLSSAKPEATPAILPVAFCARAGLHLENVARPKAA